MASSNGTNDATANSNNDGINSSLLDDIPEPDYDHLASSFLEETTNNDDSSSSSEDSLGKPKVKKPTNGKSNSSKGGLVADPDPAYILGTLVVRVVAARDLEPADGGGGNLVGDFLFGKKKGGGGTANPYASVAFGASTQRTSEAFNTLDPIWPRHETMFMDVSLPLSQITHPDPKPAPAAADSSTTTMDTLSNNNGGGEPFPHPEESPPDLGAASYPTSSNASSSSNSYNNNNTNNPHKDNPDSLMVPKPILTVAIFSAATGGKGSSKFGDNNNDSKYPSKKQQQPTSGDSDDDFLGMASVDLTQLLTGKKALIDTWLPLAGIGDSGSSSPSVRVVCEYEASDVAPSRGDFVRFTRFCHPADLHPLVPGKMYLVQDVLDNDNLLLTCTTPEGWVCSFVVHRFMVICSERHHDAVRAAQDEWHAFTERLSYSPMIGTVATTVNRLPDEGLFAVGQDAIKGGASLLGRWLEGGLGTAVKDVAFATNWDGQYHAENRLVVPSHADAVANAAEELRSADSRESDVSSSQQEEEIAADEQLLDKKPSPLSLDPVSPPRNKPLPNMPSCPITSEPMVDPVVAADGHTYERAAIARWLKESDKSPLTGSVLPHKELVPNYGLLSSLQEQADESGRKMAASTASAAAAAAKSDSAGDDPSKDTSISED